MLHFHEWYRRVMGGVLAIARLIRPRSGARQDTGKPMRSE